MKTNDTLFVIKRKLYQIAMLMGIASLLLAWGIKMGNEKMTQTDQLLFPFALIISTAITLILSLSKNPHTQLITERFIFIGFSLCILIKYADILFLNTATEGIDISRNLADFLYWVPFIYIVAFLTFEKRAQFVSVAFLVVLGSVSITFLYTHSGIISRDIFALLARFGLANISVIVLLSAVSWLKEQHGIALAHSQMMARYANTDYLTDIANRRHIDELLLREIERAKRYSQKLSVILIDIDGFKAVNDAYGHDIGDKILKEFATLIRSNLRPSDEFGRWGGEEFMILAPETDSKQACELSDRLRKLIESFDFKTLKHITASFGVASFPNENLVKAADDAMYRAKLKGKNRVEMA